MLNAGIPDLHGSFAFPQRHRPSIGVKGEFDAFIAAIPAMRPFLSENFRDEILCFNKRD